MSTPAASQLKPYSIGIVAKNKDLVDSKGQPNHVIEVTPTEHFPMLNGELSDNVTQATASGTDADGKAYQAQVSSSVTIKATWLPMGSSNRYSSPDVRRGEKVQLYQFADQDGYWWTTLTDGTSLRKLETVVWAFSGSQTEGAEVTADNYYFIEVSTHTKLIHISTSKANGEPFAYTLQLDAGNGLLAAQDDVGNAFRLSSKENLLRLQNAMGTFHELNQKNATWSVPETLTMNAKAIKVACETYDLQGNTGTIQFSQLGITAQTSHTGNILLAGNLGTTKGASGGGNVTMGGDMVVEGVGTFEQGATVGNTLKANQIVSTQNVIAPNIK